MSEIRDCYRSYRRMGFSRSMSLWGSLSVWWNLRNVTPPEEKGDGNRLHRDP